MKKEAIRLLAREARVQQAVEDIALEHADGIIVQERIDLPSVYTYIGKDFKLLYTSKWMSGYDEIRFRRKKYGAIEFSINKDLCDACDRLTPYINAIAKNMDMGDAILAMEIAFLPSSGNTAPYGVPYDTIKSQGYEFVVTRCALVHSDDTLEDLQTDEKFREVVSNVSETFIFRTNYIMNDFENMSDFTTRGSFISDAPDVVYFKFVSSTYDNMPNSWKKVTISSAPNHVRPSKVVLYKSYYYILKDFLNSYHEGLLKGDLDWLRAKYADDYIRRIGFLTIAYIKGLDLKKLHDNKIEAKNLRPQDQYAYRSDINYSYIDSLELREMLRSNELYRCIYTLLMVALKFVKDREKVGHHMTTTELNALNALIVELHKR